MLFLLSSDLSGCVIWITLPCRGLLHDEAPWPALLQHPRRLKKVRIGEEQHCWKTIGAILLALGGYVQSLPKKCVVVCVILPAGAVARSHNLGPTFLANSVRIRGFWQMYELAYFLLASDRSCLRFQKFVKAVSTSLYLEIMHFL